MSIQRIARVFGWAFVLIAIWGAFVAGTSMEADPDLAPRLWGVFPVNLLHNLVHLLLGIWGLRAASSAGSARAYAIAAGGIYLGLAALGAFTPSGFGLVPLGGADIWLHVGLGVVLLAVGLAFGGQAVADARIEPTGREDATPPVTASSAEGAVTRPPAQPGEPSADAAEWPEGHDRPVPREEAGSEGAAPAARPPGTPESVVDEPPRQPPDAPPVEEEPRDGGGTRDVDRRRSPEDERGPRNG